MAKLAALLSIYIILYLAISSNGRLVAKHANKEAGSCCGPRTYTWAHHVAAKLENSAATLTCQQNGEILLDIESSGRVEVEVVDYDLNFVQTRTACKRPLTPQVVDLSGQNQSPIIINKPPTIPTPVEVAAIIPDFDYDDMEAAAARVNVRSLPRSTISQWKIDKAVQSECGFETVRSSQACDSRPVDEQFVTELNQGDNLRLIRVKEYFSTSDGIVEILTFTYLEIVCTSVVKQPVCQKVKPITKSLEVQVCQIANYKVSAQNVGSPPSSKLETTIEQLSHPNSDHQVEWNVNDLIYSADINDDGILEHDKLILNGEPALHPDGGGVWNIINANLVTDPLTDAHIITSDDVLVSEIKAQVHFCHRPSLLVDSKDVDQCGDVAC